MTPKELRSELKAKKIKQWELARAAKVSEYTLIRWLRDDLTRERAQILTSALKELEYVKRMAAAQE